MPEVRQTWVHGIFEEWERLWGWEQRLWHPTRQQDLSTHLLLEPSAPLFGEPCATAAQAVPLAPNNRYGECLIPCTQVRPGHSRNAGLGQAWGHRQISEEKGRAVKSFPLLQGKRCRPWVQHQAGAAKTGDACSGTKSLRGKVIPEYSFDTPELGWISASFWCPVPLAFLAWLEAL